MENWTIFITELFVPRWLQTATAVASARLWNFFHLRVTDHTHNWYISFIMFDICELGINSRSNSTMLMDGWMDYWWLFLSGVFAVIFWCDAGTATVNLLFRVRGYRCLIWLSSTSIRGAWCWWHYSRQERANGQLWCWTRGIPRE